MSRAEAVIVKLGDVDYGALAAGQLHLETSVTDRWLFNDPAEWIVMQVGQPSESLAP